MQVSLQGQQLNHRSISDFRPLFCSLAAPAPHTLVGRFQAEFVGPGWLRRLAGPGLVLGGLGGWWGKDFGDQSRGTNLVHRRHTIIPILPIRYSLTNSLVDGQPTITVTYPAGSRWPWPLIIDELRQLDDTTLLGLTMATRLGLHRLPLPFLLHRYP